MTIARSNIYPSSSQDCTLIRRELLSSCNHKTRMYAIFHLVPLHKLIHIARQLFRTQRDVHVHKLGSFVQPKPLLSSNQKHADVLTAANAAPSRTIWSYTTEALPRSHLPVRTHYEYYFNPYETIDSITCQKQKQQLLRAGQTWVCR